MVRLLAVWNETTFLTKSAKIIQLQYYGYCTVQYSKAINSIVLISSSSKKSAAAKNQQQQKTIASDSARPTPRRA